MTNPFPDPAPRDLDAASLEAEMSLMEDALNSTPSENIAKIVEDTLAVAREFYTAVVNERGLDEETATTVFLEYLVGREVPIGDAGAVAAISFYALRLERQIIPLTERIEKLEAIVNGANT